MGLELQISLSTILPFFLFLFMVLNTVWRSKTKYSNWKLPPGPSKLPLIGNMHHLGALPHRSQARFANQYGPLMHIQLGELSCMVVSSPEVAKEVMNTHDIIFATRPRVLSADIVTYGSKGMTFSPYGTHWRQMRKICTMELLAPKRVMSFRSIREEELANLVKDIYLSEGSPINLSNEFNSLAYGLTSRIAFGGKSKDQQVYIEIMKDVIEAVSGFSIVDLYPSIGVLQVLTGFRTKIEKLHQEADRILEKIVKDHRDKSLDRKAVGQEEGEDLVDILLRLQNHGDLQHPVSDSVVKATILVSMFQLKIHA